MVGQNPMHLYVSESLNSLSPQEILRLQKSLHVILRHESKPDRLKSTLSSLYSNLQNQASLDQTSFHKLLKAGGVMTGKELSEKDKEELAENPYVVWPTSEYCCVAGEALESLKLDQRFLRDGYLFAFLSRLSSREIKAWSHWIARVHALEKKPSNARELYRFLLLSRISRSSHQTSGRPSENQELNGRDLKAVLTDDPASPMHWFYRDVLPFYRCLDELHQKMRKEGQGAVEPTLQAFLYGDVISFGELEGFGKPLKYRIQATREAGPSLEALSCLGQKPHQSMERTGEGTPSLF